MSKKKKTLMIVISVILIVGLSVYFILSSDINIKIKDNANDSSAFEKSWANGSWMKGIKKDLVKSITFTKKYEGKADYTWRYDNITFYQNLDGKVYIECGEGLALKSNMCGAFMDLVNLESINGIAAIDFTDVPDVSFLFKGCASLKEIDLRNANFKNSKSAASMFEGCVSLESVQLEGSTFDLATSIDNMFSGCNKLNLITLPTFNNINSAKNAFFFVGTDTDSGCKISGDLALDKCENMESMFEGILISNREFIENLNTKSLKNASRMFFASRLLSIDLSKWDTSNLEDATEMFKASQYLEACVLDNWDVSKNTSTAYMFSNCYSITSVSLKWNRPTSLLYAIKMFENCIELETIDIRYMNDLELQSTQWMFSGCEMLKKIYCTKLTAEDSEGMFEYCYELSGGKKFDENVLDIKGANTSWYFSA